MTNLEEWWEHECLIYESDTSKEIVTKGYRQALHWVMENFSISPIGSKAIREELQETE